MEYLNQIQTADKAIRGTIDWDNIGLKWSINIDKKINEAKNSGKLETCIPFPLKEVSQNLLSIFVKSLRDKGFKVDGGECLMKHSKEKFMLLSISWKHLSSNPDLL